MAGDCFVKGTVSVISSDPPFADCVAWFTTVPLKALSDLKYELDMHVFVYSNCLFLFAVSGVL